MANALQHNNKVEHASERVLGAWTVNVTEAAAPQAFPTHWANNTSFSHYGLYKTDSISKGHESRDSDEVTHQGSLACDSQLFE